MGKIITSTNNEFTDVDRQQQALQLAKLLQTADDIICDECGSKNFMTVFRIKKLSAIATGTGKEAIVPVPVYACCDCGHVNEKFLSVIQSNDITE